MLLELHFLLIVNAFNIKIKGLSDETHAKSTHDDPSPVFFGADVILPISPSSESEVLESSLKPFNTFEDVSLPLVLEFFILVVV
jgi:hypothetical protein